MLEPSEAHRKRHATQQAGSLLNPEPLAQDFVFWLHFWEIQFNILPIVSSEKTVIAIIDKTVIRILEPIQTGGMPFEIPLASIVQCELFSLNDLSLYSVVVVQTKENEKGIKFVPANPFDPTGVFYGNFEEAKAFRDVINQLRGGGKPDYSTNPYERQRVSKNAPQYALDIEDVFKGEVSPWHYYAKFMKSFERRRKIIRHVTRLALGLILIAWIGVVALSFR